MADLNVNTILNNRYIIKGKIAEGGMGVVYLATDRLTGENIALKQVKLSIIETEGTSTAGDSLVVRNAMAQEFRALASIRHPNIISVLDYGFLEDRSPFFTMDYLENFEDFRTGGIRYPLLKKIALLIQLLEALEYLHRRGLLHRDIKPGNVAIQGDIVKVLDFGLSIESERLQTIDDDDEVKIVGTLAYMAPEVLTGELATTASDLYAVGVMAYELFTGMHPFNLKNSGNLIMEIITSEPDMSIFEMFDMDTIKAQREMPNDETTDLPTALVETRLSKKTIELQAAQDNRDPKEVSPLSMILRRLLAKSAEVRYEFAGEVIRDFNLILDRPVSAESNVIRESYLQSARFVGRDKELGILQDALEEATNSRGSAWLISGETGVGKSRLVDEVRIHALIQGFVTVRGQAVLENNIPYQIWREPVRRMTIYSDVNDVDAGILKDLVHDIDRLLDRDITSADTLDGDKYKERMQTSILSLFTDVQKPLLLILEDIQWAPNSLDTVDRLATVIQDQPVVMIATYRHDEAPTLTDNLTDCKSLSLNRLTKDSVQKLSESIIGKSSYLSAISDMLYRETAGNVFFAIEVLRELAETSGSLQAIDLTSLKNELSTSGMQDILKRRLSDISTEALQLLKLTALAGREIDLALVNKLSADNSDYWFLECSNESILDTDDNGQWRFTHDGMRRTVLSAITADERNTLHTTLATAIEDLYGDLPEHAFVLATQWKLANNTEKELRYIRKAADYALHIGNLQEAREYFERTLELMDTDEDTKSTEDYANIAVQLGRTLQYLGEYDEALTLLTYSVATLRQRRNQPSLASALIEEAEVLKRQGNLVTADETLNEALFIFTLLHHEKGKAYAMDRLCDIKSERGDYEDAIQYGERGLAIATEIGDRVRMGSLMNNLGMIAFAQGDYANANRNFEDAKEIYEAGGQRRAVATLDMNMGSVAGQQGDLDTCLEYFKNALEVFENIGEKRLIGMTYHNLGFVESLKEDYVLSTQYYHESLSIARAIGSISDMSATLLSLGDNAKNTGNKIQAELNFREALELAYNSSAPPLVLHSLAHYIQILDKQETVLLTIGHILGNSATTQETRELSETTLNALRDIQPQKDVDSLLEQGQSKRLEDIVEGIIGEQSDVEK